MVLRILKPLYGVPESGRHWYIILLEYHVEKLGMVRNTAHPFVLVAREGEHISVLVALQVDDALSVAYEEFLKREETAATTFRSKARTISDEKEMAFNGVRICLEENGGIKMQQKNKVLNLTQRRDDKYISRKRAMAHYIGVNCRPDICVPVQLIAPGREPITVGYYKTLKKVKTCQEYSVHGTSLCAIRPQ